MNARGEERIDETGRIAHENVCIADERLGDIRPVADDVRTIEAVRAGE